MGSLRGKIVLHIVKHMHVGGAQVVLIDLCKMLAEEGAVPLVFTRKEGHLLSELYKNNIKVFHLDSPRFTGFFSKKIDAALFLKKIIKEQGVDLIHVHSIEGIWYSNVARDYQKVIYTAHVKHDYRLRHYVNDIDLMVVASNYINDFFDCRYGIKKEKNKLISLGIDKDILSKRIEDRSKNLALLDIIKCKHEGINFDGNVIFCPSRCSFQKGQHLLLFSFKLLSRKRSNIRLFLVKNKMNFYYSLLRLIICVLKIKDVYFLDCLDSREMAAVYDISDVVAVPTCFSETFGLVLLEAMALRKPIVTYNIGASVEIIKNKNINKICAKYNVFEFSRALDDMINLVTSNSPELRKVLDINSERVKFFDVKKMLQKYKDLYLRYM